MGYLQEQHERKEGKNMDFKLGDIICGKRNIYNITNENMTKARVLSTVGRIMHIEILDHSRKSEIGNFYDVLNSKNEFSLLMGNEMITIYRECNKTIALDNRTGERAIARCHPDDEFNFDIGAKLAFERLSNEIKTRHFNTKVVLGENICLSNNEVLIKAGKVYEIKEGSLLTERESITLPIPAHFRDMDDVQAYFGNGETDLFSCRKKYTVIEIKE